MKDPKPTFDEWGFSGADPVPADSVLGANDQWSKAPQSWWVRRWMEALTRWADPIKLARGRSYARRDQVIEIEVQIGHVVARVQGPVPTPYTVHLEINTLTEAEWGRALEAMAGQAGYAAQLLNGEMPHDIELVFKSANVFLFPRAQRDLLARCTCPDNTGSCEHVASVLLLVGERLQEDPSLLFVMRGRTRAQITSALRTKRAERANDEPTTPERTAAPAGSAEADLPLEDCLDHFWRMGQEAQTIRVHVAPPEVDMETLKMLGDPSFAGDEALSQRLVGVYRAVSQRALQVAFGE